MQQEIKIANLTDFLETIADSERVKRVFDELKNNPEIHNGIIAASYEDGFYATFEVIMNKPEKLVLCFTGTAA